MSEKDKGFGFKRLFLRDTETGAQKKQIQNEEPVNNKSSQVSVGVQEQPLVEDFVQRLQN